MILGRERNFPRLREFFPAHSFNVLLPFRPVTALFRSISPRTAPWGNGLLSNGNNTAFLERESILFSRKNALTF